MKAKNFREAAKITLDDRWYRISRAKSIREMKGIFWDSKCELCELQKRRGHADDDCGRCILNDSKNSNCCVEYQSFIKEANSKNFPEAHKQSLLLVKRLEKIAG